MELEPFDEWFAIRNDHEDNQIWAGRLSYNSTSRIIIDTINFDFAQFIYDNPYFRGDTITGYLDYQRPATVIRPLIKSAGGLSGGINTPLLRARFQMSASGILKNIHLENLDEKCFTELSVQLPAFHAWVAPTVVSGSYDGYSLAAIQIGAPLSRNLTLANGGHAKIATWGSAYGDDDDRSVRQRTVLAITPPAPFDYDTYLNIRAAIEITFCFLVGTRMRTSVYELTTTKTRRWNNAEQLLVAESWIVSSKKKTEAAPSRHSRMFIEETTPISLTTLIENFISPDFAITYLMDMVLAIENEEIPIDDSFIEILGCLEEFHKTRVAKNRERFTLFQRLSKLIEMWRVEGFKGNPDVSRLVKIRNMKPHGRGHELDRGLLQEIVHYRILLCALARFHLLKHLGFSGDEIGAAFMRSASRYAMFVPEKWRHSEPADELPPLPPPPA